MLGAMLVETGLAEEIGTSISDALGVSSIFGISRGDRDHRGADLRDHEQHCQRRDVVLIAISIAAAADVNPTIPALAAIFGANYGFMLPVSTPQRDRLLVSGCFRSRGC